MAAARACSFGFGVLHLLQFAFLANTRLPHVGQSQSPTRGCKKPCCPACHVEGACCAVASLDGVDGGQLESSSPRLSSIWSCMWGFGAPHILQRTFLANCTSLQAGQTQSPGLGSPAKPGLGVWHLLQAAFLANWKSPHAGQFQSPCFAMLDVVPAFKSPLANAGLTVAHRLHCVFLENW